MLDYTKSCNNMFYSNATIVNLDDYIEYSDTSNVEQMKAMFYACYPLKRIPNMDTSNVWTMENFAYGCTSLSYVPNLNTSKLTIAKNAFQNCQKLITIEGLDLRSCNTVSGLVSGCSKLTNLTLYNIKKSIFIGYGTSYGHLLTIESLLNCCQECINTGSALTLTAGTENMTKLADVYVKLTGEPEVDSTLPKLPMVQCESTDEGAMLVADYMALKQWSLA